MSGLHSGRTVLITGCSSGIGYASAKVLKERGWRVFASARKAADCDRLRREGFTSPRLDYADEASIAAALDEVLAETGGRLDAVFHNGSSAQPGAIEDLSPGLMRAQFESGYIGWHELTRLVIPVMRRQGAGRIVFCSSVAGFVGSRYRGAYAATKHAVEAMADTLRLELAGTAIHPIVIQPGPVRSRIVANAMADIEHQIDVAGSPHRESYGRIAAWLDSGAAVSRLLAEPEKIAAGLARALEASRPKPRYRVTAIAHTVWALNRILPTAAMDWLVSRR